MRPGYKKTLGASVAALLLGTSCCWLTTLAVWLGGASLLTVLSTITERYQIIFLTLAAIFLAITGILYIKHRRKHT